MAKTNPIGVRFDKELLDVFEEDGIADSPQKALNYLTEFYRENRKNKVDFVKTFSESGIFKEKEPVKKSSYFEQNPVAIPEVSLFGEYSEELKNARSWAEIDTTMKSVMLDGKLSRMEKDLLKEEARKARESNYC